jgi:hypothetical protein
MPITDPDWASINNLIEKVAARVSGKRQDYFITGQVIKVDAPNKLIYMAEFGDQPIPIVAFDYTVNYYDQLSDGTMTRRTVTATVKMPKVGDTVVVARELGTRRLPRVLGILQGQNWIVPEDE